MEEWHGLILKIKFNYKQVTKWYFQHGVIFYDSKMREMLGVLIRYAYIYTWVLWNIEKRKESDTCKI